MDPFVVREFDPAHPTVLALYCSDGRFTEAVERLCASLGAPRIDTVTIPGGPGLLDIGKLALMDRAAILRALDFLIRGHSIERVFLVAHEGCGYYRARYPRRGAGEIREVQVADLRSARETIVRSHRVSAHCFYARVSAGGVTFDPIS